MGEQVKQIMSGQRARGAGDLVTISAPAPLVQQLRAQVRELREGGYIGQQYRMYEVVRVVNGKRVVRVEAEVVALRPLPRPVPVKVWATAAGAIALGFAGSVAWMLWEARYIIGGALLAAAGVAVLALVARALAGGHSFTCAGLHCGGCRG